MAYTLQIIFVALQFQATLRSSQASLCGRVNKNASNIEMRYLSIAEVVKRVWDFVNNTFLSGKAKNRKKKKKKNHRNFTVCFAVKEK